MSSIYVSNIAASAGSLFSAMPSAATTKTQATRNKPAGWVDPALEIPRYFEAGAGSEPFRWLEFRMVLTPIRAAMIRFNLAIGPNEIMLPGIEATSSPYDWINTPVPLPESPQPCPLDVCA